jgi:hypothetical protein
MYISYVNTYVYIICIYHIYIYKCMYTCVYEGTFVVNQGMNTRNNGPMKVFIYLYMYIHT